MTITDLKIAIDKSNIIFKKIKIKYSELSGYLVFSSSYGQCELTSDLATILNCFPQMIMEGKQKGKALQLMQKINEIESENKKNSGKLKSIDNYKIQLNELNKEMEVDENIFMEIRFKNGDLDLIYQLQSDDLISQEQTPQTKASIRIVLGSTGKIFSMSI